MGNSDDKRYDTDVMSYHMNTSHETSFDVDSDLTYIKAKDNQIIDTHIEQHNKRKSAINKNLNKNEDCVMQSKHTRSNLDKSHIRFAKDANVKYEESVPSSGYDSDCLQVRDRNWICKMGKLTIAKQSLISMSIFNNTRFELKFEGTGLIRKCQLVW